MTRKKEKKKSIENCFSAPECQYPTEEIKKAKFSEKHRMTFSRKA